MEEITVTEQISDEQLKQINEQSATLGTRYEELFSFIYDLRQSDFQISPPQFIAIHRLIIALTRNGENPIDFQFLSTYLAPLVCSSPEEQAAFYQYFDQWLKTHKPPEPIKETQPVPPEEETQTVQPVDEQPENVRWWRNPAFIAAALLVASITTVLLLFYVPYSKSKVYSGTIRDKATEQPISDAEIRLGEETQKSDQIGIFSFEYKFSTTFFGSKSSPSPLPLTIRHSDYEIINSTVKLDDTEKQNEFNLTRIKETPTPTPKTSITPKPTTPAPVTPTSAVTPHPTPTPIQIIPPLTFYQNYYFIILLIAMLLPFVIYALRSLWWLWRRRQLERWRDRNQPNLKQLTLKKEEDFLYRSPAFRHTVQELRRHRRVQTSALDIGYTVEATVRQGGLFTPVLGKRQVSPEYLVLIDRLSFRDQKSQLEDKILDRFKKEGIFFECFYFNGDPRLCRQKAIHRKGESPKYFHLGELSVHYPEHRLLIFSDGAGMIDEFSSRPHRWINLLSEWEIRAMLTPNSALSYHEWILEQEAELPVLPARETELKTLLEIIRTGEIPKAKSYTIDKDYPPTLLEDFEQWWLRRVKPTRAIQGEEEAYGAIDKIERLFLELRYYLDKDGYFLLCACAVYPELSGDLTFYLTHRFIETSKREATLESLVCLPWFRHGMMPDWLREKLLSELTPEQEQQIRDAIERLLINYLKHPQEGFSLEIATERKPAEESLWKRLRKSLTDWRRRKFYKDIIKTEPENSPLKDYVFLNFVSGNKLAVSLPRRLSRFLQSQRDNARSGFLSRFYKACASLVTLTGNLWRKIYHRDLPAGGVSSRKGLLMPLLASALAVAVLLQFPPTYPPLGPDDLLADQLNTSEEDIKSLVDKSFATPQPIPSELSKDAKSSPLPPRRAETMYIRGDGPTECQVGECCNSLTEAAGYFISDVRAVDSENGKSLGLSKYMSNGAIYSAQMRDKIIDAAGEFLADTNGLQIKNTCAKIQPPSECLPTNKCVNLYIYTSPEKPEEDPEIVPVTVALVEKDTENRISGQVTFTNNASGESESLNVKKNGFNQISLYAGSYTIEAESEGYVTTTQTEVFDSGSANPSAFIELKRAIPKPDVEQSKPPVTQEPTPTPPSIVSMSVTVRTGDQRKGKSEEAQITIKSKNRTLAFYQGGKNKLYKTGSVDTLTIPLNSPYLVSQCSSNSDTLSILFTKTNLENDWDVSFEVKGILDDGRTVLLLPMTKEYPLGGGGIKSGEVREANVNLNCPSLNTTN